MPSFSFSISSNNKRRIVKDKILKRNVEGVVFITISGNYEVEIDNDRYIIDSSCYTCKNKDRIYKHCLDSKERICYIRTKDNLHEYDISTWLPFIEGICVIGNVIYNAIRNRNTFVIKKYFTNYENHIVIKARKFYLDNYKVINKALKEKKDAIR